jgi:putative methionine-R-sulfoxide reductase with GAF domain
MSAAAKVPRPPTQNRRRRVRQKVHAPAYASFVSAGKREMIELFEVLDISEVGVAIQCPSQLEINQKVDLCLDLAEAAGKICTPAQVIWSNSAGRAGLALSAMPSPVLHRLREWLFLNAMAAAANAAAPNAAAPSKLAAAVPEHVELRPNYTDTLNAVSAVQREVESLGPDLGAVLAVIASRSQALLRASGAAIALAGKDPQTMICGASAGECAPPVGATLHIGAGFSGECVRTARTSRCDDTETDDRVDRKSCRALGIRSMLAVPVKLGENVIGLLEVFSAEAAAFDGPSESLLQRFVEMILSAMSRVAKKASPAPSEPKPFTAPPGSVLFAQAPPVPAENRGNKDADDKDKDQPEDDQDKVGGIRLPRAHLYLLICAAATIFLALGFISAPWIQPWIQQKLHSGARSGEETVLASSGPSAESAQAASAVAAVDLASFDQLRDMAQHGDAAAEDRLGRLYAEGDEKQGVAANDKEAARWFTSAAEHGSVSAQYKLGLLYWGGHHGLPKDPNRAYFWAVLARAGGHEGGKDLATFLANGMTRAQAAAIEQQAEIWYRQHEPQAKPSPGR